jgi:hypothetical protein
MQLRFLIVIATGLLLPSLLCAQTTSPALREKTIEVKIPTEIWPGWQSNSIDEDPNPPATQPSPAQYVSYPTPPGEKPTFSGKVVGLDSYKDVEVTLITVLPREYVNQNALITTMVLEDGSFSMKPTENLDRPRTICVRAPGRPWTYLRHDFAAGQSGKDIVIPVDEGQTLTVSARINGGAAKTWMTLEAFDGYQRHDNEGKPVQSEYYGGKQSNDGTASIILPLRPMALRVRAEGSASACVIVDPREVDHLNVRLPTEARLKGRIIQDNKPQSFAPVWFFNPAARLSFGGVEADADGVFELSGLMPGEYYFIITGQQFTSTLRQGHTNDVTFTLTPP